MTSSRPVSLPSQAPFPAEVRERLSHILSNATAVQRAWLSGFLAGVDAAGGGQPVSAAGPANQTIPLKIIFASESGNCERLAADTAKLAKKQGFKPEVIDMADLNLEALPTYKKLLVIAATWGEGEPPARATHTYKDLMAHATLRLEGVEFGVLALGDLSYPDFCAIGIALDQRLEALGAKRIIDRTDCDLEYQDAASQWIRSALEIMRPAGVPASVASGEDASSGQELDLSPRTVEVTQHINLNSSRSSRQTFHIEMSSEGQSLGYEPGDALEIYPHNAPDLVAEIMALTALPAAEALRLETERDITTLSLKSLETYARISGRKDVAALAEDQNVRQWLEGRQLIDLLAAYPSVLSVNDFDAITRPLAPRAYSIASSRQEVGEEVHVLVSPVRFQAFGRERSGVASSFLADRTKVGSQLKVRLKPNTHFRLPKDPATPVIMVGPGTGVAPFRAFIQQRRASGATGKNWLLFGDRNYTHDFLYQLEWQDALKDGVLTRMDVAFSRDTPQKVYVQHRLFEQRRTLVDWLDAGAVLYVCGDASAMARDVRMAVAKALADVRGLSAEAAEVAVTALEKEKRYLQDVY